MVVIKPVSLVPIPMRVEEPFYDPEGKIVRKVLKNEEAFEDGSYSF